MARSKPAHVPPAGFFILFTSTFIVTFLIAFQKGHVSLFIPYISDTGDVPPESCVFSTLVSLCSVFLALSIYVRHLQITHHYVSKKDERGIERWNNIASCFGMASTLGLLLVANFQEDNNYPVHYSGAAICIWGGSIYFILQTYISHLMREHLSSMAIHYVRVFLSSLTVLFNIIGMVSTIAASKHAPQKAFQNTTVSPWTPEDNFWVAHVMSVCSEWTLALLQSIIILSFVPELRRMKVVFPQLKIEGISPPS